MYKLDFSVIACEYHTILDGILMTIFISLCAGLIAFFVGSIFVYYRTSPLKKEQKIANLISLSIRNTPLLIIIYLFYKGLGSFHIMLPAILCGILALGLYTAAYISDALLSGLNAIPEEHAQAAKALGFSRIHTFLYILYPQALRHGIFVLGSQFMNLVKNSSLVSFIAVTDIFYVIYKGIADSYRVFEYFILAVILYSIMSGIILLITNILNKIYKFPKAQVPA